MTNKDKTSNKLVASIRKSKTGAVAHKTSERPDAGASLAKSKPPAPVRREPAPAAKTASKQRRSDAFSTGRRVWPD